MVIRSALTDTPSGRLPRRASSAAILLLLSPAMRLFINARNVPVHGRGRQHGSR